MYIIGIIVINSGVGLTFLYFCIRPVFWRTWSLVLLTFSLDGILDKLALYGRTDSVPQNATHFNTLWKECASSFPPSSAGCLKRSVFVAPPPPPPAVPPPRNSRCSSSAISLSTSESERTHTLWRTYTSRSRGRERQTLHSITTAQVSSLF